MATPILEARERCGSRVEFSAMTANTTSPGLRYFRPSFRVSILQLGGKMEETRTRFCAAMPASRRASSNEVKRSLCFPTPFVKNMRFGTMFLPNSVGSSKMSKLSVECNTAECEQCVKIAACGTKNMQQKEGTLAPASVLQICYRSRPQLSLTQPSRCRRPQCP